MLTNGKSEIVKIVCVMAKNVASLVVTQRPSETPAREKRYSQVEILMDINTTRVATLKSFVQNGGWKPINNEQVDSLRLS